MSILNDPQPTLGQAIDLTRGWREYYASLLNDGSSPDGIDIFRGFKIPISDLVNMLAVAGTYNQLNNTRQITDIRAYLAKGPEEGSPVHILMVPVSTAIDGPANQEGKDEYNMNGMDTIYNFTTPCPIQCDITSPLYRKEE